VTISTLKPVHQPAWDRAGLRLRGASKLDRRPRSSVNRGPRRNGIGALIGENPIQGVLRVHSSHSIGSTDSRRNGEAPPDRRYRGSSSRTTSPPSCRSIQCRPTGVAQTNLIGAAGTSWREPLGERVGQRRHCRSRTHFGVQPGRTGIEIERPDEHPRNGPQRTSWHAGWTLRAGARTPGPADPFLEP